jgi:hypothetical protein
MITKTDLAKYILSFEGKPYVVSLGAQKAFAGSSREPGFVSYITQRWTTENDTFFGELWFQHAISKAILFRDLDRAILKAPWYTAYKANIVTYTLARFQHAIETEGRVINYTEIWQKQATPHAIAQDLLNLAKRVSESLLNPPENTTRNVSEWAKQPSCWSLIKELSWLPSEETRRYTLESSAAKSEVRKGMRDQGDLNKIQSLVYITEKGISYWQSLSDWNEKHRILSPDELAALRIACCPGKVPMDRQAKLLIEGERRAKSEGFWA